jgi:hypothetical protein
VSDESPAADPLTTDKIEVLRRWGQGLAAAGRDEEMRAAGRAILILADEIDRLNRDLWHTRAGVSADLPGLEPPAPAAEAEGEPSALTPVEALKLRLLARLPRLP